VVFKHAALRVPECPCGWRCGGEDGPEATAWRAHCFWGCPVAGAVSAALPAPIVAPTSVVCFQVWLLQPPAGVRAGLWAVVAALVVDAMERGRRRLSASRGRVMVLPLARTVAGERAGVLATADVTRWRAVGSVGVGSALPWGWRCAARVGRDGGVLCKLPY
jgi:hypothetical protein